MTWPESWPGLACLCLPASSGFAQHLFTEGFQLQNYLNRQRLQIDNNRAAAWQQQESDVFQL